MAIPFVFVWRTPVPRIRRSVLSVWLSGRRLAVLSFVLLSASACTSQLGRLSDSGIVPVASPSVESRSPVPTFTPTVSVEATAMESPTVDATQIIEPVNTPMPAPTELVIAPTLPGTKQNFEVVGHTALGSIGWHGGLALAGDCAYVGNRRSGAVTIVDIGNPANPVEIGRIPFRRGSQPVEVRTLPERNLLVVADLAVAPYVHTFDIADCTNPTPISTFDLPVPAHEFYLWQNEGRALLFAATFGGPPDLVVVDLTNPATPEEVARWSASAVALPGRLHSIAVSEDGNRAYLALWEGGFAVADLALPDLSVIGADEPGAPVFWFPNTHTAQPLTDPRYVLLTSEIYTCPFGGVLIVDVADAANPVVVSSFTLPENRCENPTAPAGVFTAHNPLVIGDLVFLSWYGGGLQVLDVADPTQPQRVGQFVPAAEGAAAESYVGRHPVQTWSYPILRDGLLYVADIQSGLHIVRYIGPGADVVAATSYAEGNVTVSPSR
ncbi:hypothetical protein GC175_33295 [bacterium]|nr:hypothetical protein [bacterium]